MFERLAGKGPVQYMEKVSNPEQYKYYKDHKYKNGWNQYFATENEQ